MKLKKYLSPNELKHLYYEEIGDRIIFLKSSESKIVIVNNRSFLEKSGIGFAVGGILFIGFIFFSNSQKNPGAIIFGSLIVLPFIITGLRYYLRSRKDEQLVFDLDRKELTINKHSKVPFTKINKFNLSKLPSASRTPTYSYQLNLTFDNGHEYMLFSDSDQSAVLLVSEFLTKMTRIHIDRTFHFA